MDNNINREVTPSLPVELNTFCAALSTTPIQGFCQKRTTIKYLRQMCVNTLKKVNIQKAVGPDNIPDHALKACTHKLPDVFTDIFNPSLLLSVVPTCFKRTTIIPVLKKPSVSCLNNCHTVALTSIVMKCFECTVKECTCHPHYQLHSSHFNLPRGQTDPKMMQ